MTPIQAAEQIGAQLYATDTNGTKPTLYYRWETVINNEGDAHTSLQYHTHAGMWHCAASTDPDKFARESLTRIPGVPLYDPVAAEAAVRQKELDEWGEEEHARITALRAENKTKSLERRKSVG